MPHPPPHLPPTPDPSPTGRPQRVRVTGPPRGAHPVPQAAAREIDEGTAIGAIYVRTLLREQLRLAVLVLVVLALTLGTLPLLFHLAPGLAERRLLGVPLPWALLGAGAYPLLLALGWSYVRRAEAVEENWAALVAHDRDEEQARPDQDRPDQDPPGQDQP